MGLVWAPDFRGFSLWTSGLSAVVETASEQAAWCTAKLFIPWQPGSLQRQRKTPRER